MFADGGSWQPLVFILLLLGLLISGAAILFRRSRNRRSARPEQDDTDPLPPLIFSMHARTPAADEPGAPNVHEPSTPPLTSAPTQSVQPAATAPPDGQPAPDTSDEAGAPPPSMPPEDTPAAQEEAPAAGAAARPPGMRFAIVSPPPDGAAEPAEQALQNPPPVDPLRVRTPGAARRGGVPYHRPPDGTLQLLPGRLVVHGGASQRELRFVRAPGTDTIVTFGRMAGDPLSHIRLDAPTISRLHAQMRFHAGTWHIANLSRTNPVVVNGQPLIQNGSNADVPLKDGDRIEMGELMFRFRMP